MRRTTVLSLAVLLLACDKSTDATTADAKAPGATPEADARGADAEPAPAKPAIAAGAKAEVGKPAPDFTLRDTDGVSHTLSAYAGKTIVLEWFNPQCPFVKHAHTEGSLVTMAKDETAKEVVWLAVNSGAPGKQGHGAEANTEGKTTFGLQHPILLDETGAVGRAYGAQKTPHVYLIDAEGTLRYRGAIDNAPFGEVDGGGETVNYLGAALEELRAGTPVSTAETPPYGCSVKYG
ncbi:MAG: thioredoxin family protein [bacterium]|nr:thioredoxin family protein [bacterium]